MRSRSGSSDSHFQGQLCWDGGSDFLFWARQPSTGGGSDFPFETRIAWGG
jgi:hypothetical protein